MFLSRAQSTRYTGLKALNQDSMTFETIKFEMQGAVAVITLNRPASLNALTIRMGEELQAALSAATEVGTRAMLLTGEGRAFCAGGDLREMHKIAEQEGRVEAFFDAPLRMLNDCVMLFRSARFPIVAAVNGVAFGAGCNFALACDLVIAAESARFSESFVNIGLSPDCGGTYILPRLVGVKRAAYLMMTGESVTARQAYEMGMINDVVPDAELLETAMKLTERLAAGPTGAIIRVKEMLEKSAVNDYLAQLDVEHAAQLESGKSNDFREGVTAFLEKRPPRFTGK
jgi:2-(1,2-epoxy-1,2-dihydrophenyl)acetyl-CoA isomerase